MTKVERYRREAVYWCSRYLLLQRHLTARSTVMGMRFRFRAADAMGRNIYKRGAHEPDLTEVFIRRIFPALALRAGDVVLDVGANLGWYGVLFRRLAPAGVKIFSFEPDPANYDLLTQNLVLNGCADVKAVAVGASDHDGSATLYVYPSINRGKHSMVPLARGRPVEVPIRRLDGYVAEQGIPPDRVRLVKIDIEGYEHVALQGMSEILKKGPVVVTELAPRYLKRAGIEMRDYLSYLASFGLRPHVIDGDELKRAEVGEVAALTGDNDLVWVRIP